MTFPYTDPDALAHELADIRASGIAHDAQEYKWGLCAFAAPVHDAAGAVCAALALPLLVGGNPNAETETIQDALRAAAREIARAMGFRER